ncbi:hypothetical protein SAMN06265364_12540 [Prevotella jejuni]|uniref:Uncharacterized protein n=1 Tax=Prevotella jejuni TaxID=1177574 RepID=A0AA94IVH0_9BACT|nr:hypothetical protein SAMN06265364_12540 [Prevotella jejuni]
MNKFLDYNELEANVKMTAKVIKINFIVLIL